MKSFARYFGVDAPVVFASFLALVALLVLSAMSPAHAQSANVYSYGQQTQSVQYGIVVNVREVAVAAPNNGTTQVSSVVGATLGGALGAHLGQNAGWQGQSALSLIGAALGGLGGNRIGESATTQRAIEILVMLRGTYNPPQTIAVVQPFPGPRLVGGESVAIIGNGAQTRVVPVNIDVPQAAPKLPATYQPTTYQATASANNTYGYGQ